MLKESHDAIVTQVQEISIHGQMSTDLVFAHVDDPSGQLRSARVGPEAIVGSTLKSGDRVRLDYLVGVVVQVTRLGDGPA